jgi:hypothetical protein
MANNRALGYWWPNGYPTKWGLCVPWNNYNGAAPITVMSASSYLNTKFFNPARPGVNSFDSTVYPYHGCVPPYYTYTFDFPEGWAQTNWKTAMYLPMLYEASMTKNPTNYANFKALLAQYPNRRVLIGNEPNDTAQARVTPQEFADAILDLREVAPNLQWVGPNIIEPFGADPDPNLNNTSASCSTLSWLNAYHALVVANPDLKPTVWSFHIYADNTTLWNSYWTLISQWMIAHNYKVNSYTAEPLWLTETALGRCTAGGGASNATVAEQQGLINIINSYMTTRSDFPIKMCFTYCAVDDMAGGHKIGAFEVAPPTTPATWKPLPNPYSNNEYEAWNAGVGAYEYTSVGQYWDDRVTYWPSQPPYTAAQKRPWPAPKRAPAVKVPAYPLLAPSL